MLERGRGRNIRCGNILTFRAAGLKECDAAAASNRSEDVLPTAGKVGHQNITLRQPESTSMARAKEFNKKRIKEFFDILEKICEDSKLDATRILNVGESGYSTVQKKNRKILAQKGKHQAGVISSGERDMDATAVCCLRTNPGLCLIQFQMSQLISEAYTKPVTIEDAISGFRASGVWQVDRYVFKDHQLAASEILNCEDAVERISDTSENIEESELEAEILENCETDASQLQVSIEDILPVPKAMPKTTKRI
ncbi:hypothetical protein ILUMI_00457 [Ignelater luminosus]|uniref:Uncharacterized protein n=1 Tax=Ignelater luminosus TaxID=2038154 RepID=A0A8K0DG84_IGNLU|nr:hypothetical protein ILUMI_00457 [Ignelater luminosus]